MRKLLIGTFTTLLSSGFLFFNSAPDALMHVYFLNIGEGDATLIRTPGGENILIDGGPDRAILTELKDTLPFFDNSIDYMLLTHPDSDHISGLIYVLGRYQVKNVIFTGGYKGKLSKIFLKKIKDKNIPIIIADANSDIRLKDGVTIDVLAPFRQSIGKLADTNNSSLIVKIIYAGKKVLITGDAEADTEEKLLRAKVDLDSDVLKVGHHGSKTSSTKDFLNEVSPDYAVISVGKNNSYHHPHPSALARLAGVHAKILRTDLNGRVEVTISKASFIKVKTDRNVIPATHLSSPL